MSDSTSSSDEEERNVRIEMEKINPNGKFGRKLREKFMFDHNYTNMNHGSFGTYPRPVRHALRAYQDRAEARPDQVLRYEYIPMLDASRAALAKLLNVAVETIVLVANATTGVNTILRNLKFEPGDVILYLDAIYPACEKTIQYLTETTPVEAVKVADFCYPVEDDQLVQKFRDAVKNVQKQDVASANGAKKRVKIAVYDTVCSMPGVRLPFEKLTQACRELGVLSLIDGAHGIGHIPLDLAELDSDFFVSNCHKWLFVPRGCAVMHVPLRNQHLIRSSLPTSHGFIPEAKPGQSISSPLPPSNKSAFVANFEYVGTNDDAPYTCVPLALDYRDFLGGEAAIMAYCVGLACEGGKLVANILGTEVMDNSNRTHSNCCFTMVRLPLDMSKMDQVIERRRYSQTMVRRRRVKDHEQLIERVQKSPVVEGDVNNVIEKTYDADSESAQAQWTNRGYDAFDALRKALRRQQEPRKEDSQEAEWLQLAEQVQKNADATRDWMVKNFLEQYNTFLAIIFYRGQWWVRLSAQVYLELADFRWCASVLKSVCK